MSFYTYFWPSDGETVDDAKAPPGWLRGWEDDEVIIRAICESDFEIGEWGKPRTLALVLRNGRVTLFKVSAEMTPTFTIKETKEAPVVTPKEEEVR